MLCLLIFEGLEHLLFRVFRVERYFHLYILTTTACCVVLYIYHFYLHIYQIEKGPLHFHNCQLSDGVFSHEHAALTPSSINKLARHIFALRQAEHLKCQIIQKCRLPSLGRMMNEASCHPPVMDLCRGGGGGGGGAAVPGGL